MDYNIKEFAKSLVTSWAYCKNKYASLAENIEGYKQVSSLSDKVAELKGKSQGYEYVMRLMIEYKLLTQEELDEIKKSIGDER
jgi:hypothetical protein